MKQIYQAFLAIVLLISIGLNGYALKPKPLVWFLDYKQVTKIAEEENKPILLFFQGSDWCKQGIEMQKEVFGNEQFVIYATKRIICVYIDFPYKNELSDEQNRHNKKMKKDFNIPEDYEKGFPTIIIVDKSGKVMFQETGYNGQGPQSLIDKISMTLKKIDN